MRVLIAPLLGLCVSACGGGPDAGTPAFSDTKPMTIQRARSADAADYDFLVTIQNVKGQGYDPDDQTARDRVALSALKEQCEAPQIVKETVSDNAALFGGPSRTYQIQVKC
jgi:hypothetical protein